MIWMLLSFFLSNCFAASDTNIYESSVEPDWATKQIIHFSEDMDLTRLFELTGYQEQDLRRQESSILVHLGSSVESINRELVYDSIPPAAFGALLIVVVPSIIIYQGLSRSGFSLLMSVPWAGASAGIGLGIFAPAYYAFKYRKLNRQKLTDFANYNVQVKNDLAEKVATGEAHLKELARRSFLLRMVEVVFLASIANDLNRNRDQNDFYVPASAVIGLSALYRLLFKGVPEAGYEKYLEEGKSAWRSSGPTVSVRGQRYGQNNLVLELGLSF